MSCSGREASLIFIFLICFILLVSNCVGHGRLIEPPSRASAWRYGFHTPPDYNDHELYCGGFTRQWKQNGGKCGECGDAWDLPDPRPHEYGGQWGQGVIVRKYNPGAEIILRVELTASHMGFFEFRLCPEPNAKQDCLDKNLLILLGGSPSQPMPTDLETRFYPRNGSRIYEIKALLPDIKCSQCVLQWRYVAGNNWGLCPDGNGAVGCGPQEEFRACSDIAVGGVRTPIRPLRPTPRPTLGPKSYPSSTEKDKAFDGQDVGEDSDSIITSLIIGFLLFLAICIATFMYAYRFHRGKLEKWMQTTVRRFCWTHNKETKPNLHVVRKSGTCTTNFLSKDTNDTGTNKSIDTSPPIPPPRTKRLSQVKEISTDGSNMA